MIEIVGGGGGANRVKGLRSTGREGSNTADTAVQQRAGKLNHAVVSRQT